MTTKRWLGTAPAVAQVSTAVITAYDVATTYTVTIGGIAVSVIGQGGTTATTATALRTALNASTHPYFSSITWSGSGSDITGTADTAGVPFVAASSVAAGTGTFGAFSNTTANAGPSDWSTAANWSGGVVPVSTDDIIIEGNDRNIMWGLDQNAVDLTSLKIMQSYTGKIGLNSEQFATSADGETADTGKTEYRQSYLKIGWDRADIGQSYGPSVASGSQRVKLNNDKAGAGITTIHGSASAGSDANLPAIRLLFSNAAHDLYVRSAPGGVGVASENASETSTMGRVSCSDTSSGSRVSAGPGVTLASWDQLGGSNVLQAAATITTVDVDGGTLQLEGDYTVTTLNQTAGTVTDNHRKTSGNAITTLNLQGGTYNAKGSNEARTVATLNLSVGAILQADGGVMTFTARNFPGGPFTVAVT
jgi:hypothetical protein